MIAISRHQPAADMLEDCLRQFPVELIGAADPRRHQQHALVRDQPEFEQFPGRQLQQGAQGQRQQSAAQPLGGVHRDRYWKLVANPAETATAPTLRLGYQPEVLVFLSQGAAPYALAVGSATARRMEAPIGVLIEELRQRNDPSWQPTLARLEGSPEPLAGDAALKPQLDWKAWLLWALLGLGVLVVGGLAVSLLRQKPAPSA